MSLFFFNMNEPAFSHLSVRGPLENLEELAEFLKKETKGELKRHLEAFIESLKKRNNKIDRAKDDQETLLELLKHYTYLDEDHIQERVDKLTKAWSKPSNRPDNAAEKAAAEAKVEEEAAAEAKSEKPAAEAKAEKPAAEAKAGVDRISEKLKSLRTGQWYDTGTDRFFIDKKDERTLDVIRPSGKLERNVQLTTLNLDNLKEGKPLDYTKIYNFIPEIDVVPGKTKAMFTNTEEERFEVIITGKQFLRKFRMVGVDNTWSFFPVYTLEKPGMFYGSTRLGEWLPFGERNGENVITLTPIASPSAPPASPASPASPAPGQPSDTYVHPSYTTQRLIDLGWVQPAKMPQSDTRVAIRGSPGGAWVEGVLIKVGSNSCYLRKQGDRPPVKNAKTAERGGVIVWSKPFTRKLTNLRVPPENASGAGTKSESESTPAPPPDPDEWFGTFGAGWKRADRMPKNGERVRIDGIEGKAFVRGNFIYLEKTNSNPPVDDAEDKGKYWSKPFVQGFKDKNIEIYVSVSNETGETSNVDRSSGVGGETKSNMRAQVDEESPIIIPDGIGLTYEQLKELLTPENVFSNKRNLDNRKIDAILLANMNDNEKEEFNQNIMVWKKKRLLVNLINRKLIKMGRPQLPVPKRRRSTRNPQFQFRF